MAVTEGRDVPLKFVARDHDERSAVDHVRAGCAGACGRLRCRRPASVRPRGP